MSPLERWKDAFTVQDLRLPLDPDELDIHCSDWDTATVSHIGIEKANCVFNNAELQALRRRHHGPDSLVVQIRWNKDRMRCVWAQDAVSKEWLEVPNTDARKATLSAEQIALEKKIANLPGDLSVVVSQVRSRKARQAIANELAAASKVRTRNNAMRKLGVTVQPPHEAQSGSGSAAISGPAMPPKDPPLETHAAQSPPKVPISIPRFNVVTLGASDSDKGPRT